MRTSPVRLRREQEGCHAGRGRAPRAITARPDAATARLAGRLPKFASWARASRCRVRGSRPVDQPADGAAVGRAARRGSGSVFPRAIQAAAARRAR